MIRCLCKPGPTQLIHTHAVLLVRQFHMHWGKLNEDKTVHPGTEHLIDGKREAMELHLVHYKG